MDLSVFFRNKRVFWMWIFTPLLIRIICTTALAGIRQNVEDRIATEQALASTTKDLEQAIAQADELLQRFEPSTGLSYREIFLTDFSKILFETNINGTTKVKEPEATTGGRIRKYEFHVSGTAPSLHALSLLLDEAARMDYLQLQAGDIFENLSQDEVSYTFSLIFERIETATGKHRK